MSYSVIVLLLLHLLFLIFSLFFLITEIRKNRKITLVSYFKLFYLIFFGLSPLFVLLNFNSNNIQYYFTQSISFYYYTLCVIVIFYCFFCFLSRIFMKSKKDSKYIIIEEGTSFFIINIVFSIIGLIALLLWTKAYGKPWDMIKYASAVRSGYIILDNPYTFVKPLCIFSLVAFLGLIFKKNNGNSIVRIIAIIIDLFVIIMYSLASDSRTFMVTCVLVIFASKYNKNLNFNVKTCFKILIFLVFVLIFFGKINTITYYIRYHEYRQNDNTNNISNLIVDNFSYTYRNVVNIQYNIVNGRYTNSSEFTDLKNIIFSWVPTRIKKQYTYTLANRNSDFYVETRASIPSDIITSGFYKFHYFGILIMPLIAILYLRFLEARIGKINGSFGMFMYNLNGCLFCQMLVSNYDLSIILFNLLCLIIYYIIVILFCKKNDMINGG